MHLPSIKSHPFFNCGNPDCAICSKAHARLRVQPKITKQDFSSEGVAPFIGHYGYPHVNMGILAPPEVEEESWLYDAPTYWAQNRFTVPQVVDFRSSLINSRVPTNVRARNKFLELGQEVALASKPTDMDVHLKEKPHFRMNVDSHSAPMGPIGKLEKAKLTENPNIDTKVQKVHYTNDMKAAEAMTYLYDNKFDENFLTRILSVGSIGVSKNRKLVPTRWSITATDDTLGKHIIPEIKKYNHIDHSVYCGDYLGNYYIMLCFPDVWSYELFETHVSSPTHYMSDFESFAGRKKYADNTAGGYYTVRLAVLEQLRKVRRQGAVLALRFITGDYTLPLGVWVTREASRNAMKNKPVTFSSKELMLDYVEDLVRKKFGVDVSYYLKRSLLMKSVNEQSKLFQFIS